MADFDVWNGKPRLALLIGIDKYDREEVTQLHGCVNDIESLAGVLGELFDFAVVCLKDGEATRENVLDAMRRLLDAVQPGDQIVLGWSGHGSTLAVKEGPPFETLVPADSGRKTWEDNRDITDRELFGWVWQVSEKTRYLTLIIDACQCGSIVRDFQAPARGAAGDYADTPALLRVKNAFTDTASGLRAGHGKSGWLPVSDRYTLLAACLATEKCREIEDPKTGHRRGLFSYHLHRALCDLKNKVTWRDLFDEVAATVTLENKNQHPQLEGNMDLAIFGQEIFKPRLFLPVLEQRGDRIVLGGGAVQGVQLDSRWSLQPAGSRQVREAGPGAAVSLGEVRIDTVEPTRAEGRRAGGARGAADAAGSRAFESFRPVDSRYRVLLDPAAAADKELVQMLEASPYLQLRPGKDGATGDVALLRIPARDGCRPEDPLPQVPRLPVASWAFLAPLSGAQLAPLHGTTVAGHRRKVLDKLEQLARHAFLRRLSHPGDQPAAHETVEVKAFRLFEGAPGDKPRAVEIEKDTVLESGHRIAFRVQHQHPRLLQVYLFGLGLTGGIEMLFPARGRYEPLAAGGVLEIGFQQADALELAVPQSFPIAGEKTEAVVEDHMLFLFTEKVTRGIELMVQEGMRSGDGRIRPATPLDLALGVARGDQTVRHGAAVDGREGQESWGLVRWKVNLRI